MTKQRNVFFLLVVISVFATSAIAQELVYEQREYQVSYDGKVGNPAIVFNGIDFAAFYSWSGIEDAGSGLYMRRLDSKAAPLGPQRKLIDFTPGFSYSYAVWDGSAYIVFISLDNGVAWSIVRVDKQGSVLAQRKIVVATSGYPSQNAFPFVIGETAYLFFCSEESNFEFTPSLLMVNRELSAAPTVTTLSDAGLKEPKIMGVAMDPEKFLVLLAQIKPANETKQGALLHVDFEGNLKKTVKQLVLPGSGSQPAEKIQTGDLQDIAGPIYTGSGYALAGSRLTPVGTGSFPNTNSSVLIDEDGEIIGGPYKVGGGSWHLFGRAFMAGGNVGFSVVDTGTFNMEIMLLGSKGKHITNTPVQESRFSLIPENLNSVYAGSGCATLILGANTRNTFETTFLIYSNMVTDPASAKPSVQYFLSDDGSAFGDTRRLVMWSVSSGTKISLKGKGVKMKGMPPVYHAVVDTKGKKIKLRLRFKGTDGKNKKSKLVIKP